MNQTAIQIHNLSKRYKIGRAESYKTLRDAISLWGPKIFSGKGKSEDAEEGMIWALKNISFEIKKGEVVGIIGRNGAGKSTLLKILSQITDPSEGSVDIYGKVSSLLEVGTGFHPELTGRENVYLNAAILGMKKREIQNRFDEIVAFAEVEKFMDTPVKHFSSGMYMRLAFSIAAHLSPDIMIVDEVLAVGDAAFQKKCLDKMDGAAKSGRTILFVNHNLGQIRRLCTSALWLENGQCKSFGPVGEVTAAYQASLSNVHFDVNESIKNQEGFVSWRIEGLDSNVIEREKPFTLECRLQLKRKVYNGHHGLILKNVDGQNVAGWAFNGLKLEPGLHILRYQIPYLPLRPGTYYLYASLWDGALKIDASHLMPELIFATPEYSELSDEWAGILNLPCSIDIKKVSQ